MKSTTILIRPTVRLRTLPPEDLAVLRRFFTQDVRGMDAKHDHRWRMFARDLFKAEAGEGFQLWLAEERSGPFHRRHRVILERLWQQQDRFRTVDKLHDWIKVGAGFVTWAPGKDHKPVPLPRSTAFEECSEAEMREFHEDAIEFLRSPYALRRLFTHVKTAQRLDMLETLLRNPDDDAYWETFRP